MGEIIDFKIIEGEKSSLERQILEYLKKGWSLKGGSVFAFKNGQYKTYSQTIILIDKKEKEIF